MFVLTHQDRNALANFAEGIRIERLRKRLSQEKLAELADISVKYISDIENNKVNPSIVVIVRICNVLNLEFNQLMKK